MNDMKKVFFILPIVLATYGNAQVSSKQIEANNLEKFNDTKSNLEEQINSIYSLNDENNNNQLYELLQDLDNTKVNYVEATNNKKIAKSLLNDSDNIVKIKTELSKYYEKVGDQLALSSDKSFRRIAADSYRRSLKLSDTTTVSKKYDQLKKSVASVIFVKIDDGNRELRFTNNFKKDIITYLNKKYDYLVFKLDNKQTPEYVIDLNLENFSVSNFVATTLDGPSRIANGVVTYNGRAAESFNVNNGDNLASNAVIKFVSDIKIYDANNNLIDKIGNDFLISKEGVSKNNELLVNSKKITEIDNAFLDYIKPNSFVNTQKIGFESSGFSENNARTANKQADIANQSIIFSVILADLEKALKNNKLI